MSKRKSKSTVARSRNKPMRAPRNAIPWMGYLCDPATGTLFDAATRQPIPRRPELPPPTADEIAARNERARLSQQRYADRRAAFRARLSRRPAEMQRAGYRLPADVAAFLRRFHDEPAFYSGETEITVGQAREMIEAAYMDGCRQGYIEGFLYGEDKARPGALRNRERLRQQNLEKLQRLGIVDRNAEIVAEFHRLEHDLPGKEQRYEELAARHDLTTRQISNIVRKAPKRRR